MIWTVLYSDRTSCEILTDSNSYEEAFEVAKLSKTAEKNNRCFVIAILKGRHSDTVRFNSNSENE